MIKITFKDRPEEALCWRMPNIVVQKKEELSVEKGLAVLIKKENGESYNYRYGIHELDVSRKEAKSTTIEIFVFVVSETQCYFGGRSKDHSVCANGSYYVNVVEGYYNPLLRKLGTVEKAILVDDITRIANQNLPKVITETSNQAEFTSKIEAHLSEVLGEYGLQVSNVSTDYYGE